MGIPRFYRYISERYPQINELISDVSLLPEFDNLYLDMNGILHQCTHGSKTFNEKDQILAVFNYIDRIVTHIVKPKKLVYLAIDGVAPRAKLNQQRSRRFRAGLELLKARNENDDEEEDSSFDSNAITPGTEFMCRMSKHIKYFIRQKLKQDVMWQNLTIIFSGHEVPGEGEHKIVDFIRSIKSQDGYPANLRHCMYGSDADLMLLGIATHEPHFTLVREVVDWNMNRKGKNGKNIVIRNTSEMKWQLVHLSLFREYLDFELRCDASFYDTERALDDFVFMTFFLGNDFIPHSPTLEIGEGAIALLLKLYRNLLPTWGGFLTNAGKLEDPSRLQSLFTAIGDLEEEILEKRKQEKSKYNNKFKKDKPPAMEVDEFEDDFEEQLLTALQEHKYVESDDDDDDDELIVLSGSQSFQDTKSEYYSSKFKIQSNEPSKLEQVKTHYVESLLWCLAYYYQGTPSWTWFYPYHYSPLVSELSDIGQIAKRISFSIGEPLRPFEQLLSCLPAASGNLLPKSYEALMTCDDSPIIEYYPHTFEIDMNGKRNEWEGVNLLPFIDSDKLIAAVQDRASDQTLSDEERRRNKKGHVLWFTHDTSIMDNILSSSPAAGLPDIEHCNSRVTIFTLPKLPPSGFKPIKVPGTTLPLAGFPTLNTLRLQNVELKSTGLNCFGRPSQNDTLIIEIQKHDHPVESPSQVQQFASKFIGQVAHANWPNLHEVKIVGMSTQDGEYRKADGENTAIFRKFQSLEAKAWTQKAFGESRNYLIGREDPGTGGMDIGDIHMFLHVNILQGMVRNPENGAYLKKFGTEESLVPLQLVLLNSTLNDPRFKEMAPPTLQERFPKGAHVVVTTGKYCGNVCKVSGINKDLVVVETYNINPEPPFGHMIAEQVVDRYHTSYHLSKRLGISTRVIGMIVGSVVVNPGRHDIGLNIKVKKAYKLLGYCQLNLDDETSEKLHGSANSWSNGDAVKIIGKLGNEEEDEEVDSRWEYSDNALRLMAAYKKKFPNVLKMLEELPYARSYRAEDLFTGTVYASTQLENLVEWLKDLTTHKIELVPVATRSMSKKAIAAVEEAANVRANLVNSMALEAKMVALPPQNMFLPNPRTNHDISCVLRSACPQLGDRVVNLTARNVPFGVRGTVVVLHPNSACVEVVFDVNFVGGTTLSGACSMYRGKLVPWKCLLCVSVPSETKPAQVKKAPGQNKKGASPTKATKVETKKVILKKKPVHVNDLKPDEKLNHLFSSASIAQSKDVKQAVPHSELEKQSKSTTNTSDKKQNAKLKKSNKKKSTTPKSSPPKPKASPPKPKASPPKTKASPPKSKASPPTKEQQEFQNVFQRTFQGQEVRPPPAAGPTVNFAKGPPSSQHASTFSTANVKILKRNSNPPASSYDVKPSPSVREADNSNAAPKKASMPLLPAQVMRSSTSIKQDLGDPL